MARLSSMSGARLIGAGLAGVGAALSWPLGRWHGPRMRAELASRSAPLYRLATAHGPLTFRCGSAESVKAAARFVYDEPETVWWIDQIVQPGDCVWDVGANVGLYALYAASRVGVGGTVVAFEPAADNYAALCRNVALNPMAASVQAFSADDFLDRFAVRAPDHVKIDVDSIEERIVRGGASAFANTRSIIVELNIGETADSHKASLRQAIEALGFHELTDVAARFPDRRNRIFAR
jgi:precorrin-6B methylase 2